VGLSFDKAKGIYRTAKGKEIPYAYVRGAVDAVADDTKARLLNLSQGLIDKKRTFASWASESEDLIRKSLVASGQIASGGRSQLSPKLNGTLGQKVRFHLEKFREFGNAIEAGELSDAQILDRVRKYADSVSNLFEQMRHASMIESGMTEARNIPGASEKPCSECPEITAKGWMPIGDYKPPGMRKCKSADKCGSEYR
jgi:hypothetical protein